MMRSMICRMAAWTLLGIGASILPAQDGPRLVASDQAEFLIPPAPGDAGPGPSAGDAESEALIPQSPDDAAGPPDTAVPSAPGRRDDGTAGLPAEADHGGADLGVPPDGPRENYLGVFTDPLPSVLADQFAEIVASGEGLLVTGLVNGAAADQAGLRVNDILVSYDGERLTSPEDLKRLVVMDEPGATVEFTVIRSAQMQAITVALGQRSVRPPLPSPPVAVAPPPRDPFPIGIHLPGPRSIIVDRFGLRSPWVSVDWGSRLAGRRFQALTPDGRQFEVEVRVHPERGRIPYWRY